MFYLYDAIPKGIVADFIRLNQALEASDESSLWMSPLMACIDYHQSCYELLQSKEENRLNEHSDHWNDYELVRFMFYKLEEQMNPIVFQLHEWWSLDPLIPQLLARALYLIIMRTDLAVDEECNVDSEGKDFLETHSQVVQFLKQDIGGEVSGFEECIRRLTIIVVNRKWKKQLKQAVLLIYLTCLSDRYCDQDVEQQPFKLYKDELVTLLIQHKHLSDFKTSDFSYWENISEPTCSDDHDPYSVERSIVSRLQTVYRQCIYPPQLRQLSFPFKGQQPFGDCQELNIFETFINTCLYNYETKQYDWSFIKPGKSSNQELLQILEEFPSPKYVNALSFRRKWHAFVQGKPHLFQYVNMPILNQIEFDYELEVTVFNLLACAEYLYGITLEKFQPVKKYHNFSSYLQMRSQKEDSKQVDEADVALIKQSRTRICLEKGFKREKKWLEQALEELGQQISTPTRTYKFKLDRSSKQSHNLTHLTITTNNQGDSREIKLTTDQYGAHVATYIPARKQHILSQFNQFNMAQLRKYY